MADTQQPDGSAPVTDDSTPAPESQAPAVALGADESDAPPPTLAPLTPADKPAKQGRTRKNGKGRPRKYATAEEARIARNKAEKDRRDRERAQKAAEDAAGIQHNARTGANQVHEPPAPALGTLEQQQDAERERLALEASTQQLGVMLGLGADLLAQYVPRSYGGGNLTADERALLGGVWATALAPYMGGVASPLMVAAVTTVQVFAIRAIQQRPDEQAPQAPASTQGPPPASTAASDQAAPAADEPPAPRATVQRGAIAAPIRKSRVPLYTGDN